MTNLKEKILERITSMMTADNLEKYVLGTDKKTGKPRSLVDLFMNKCKKKKKKKKKDKDDGDYSYSLLSWKKKKKGKGKKGKKGKKKKKYWNMDD